MFWLRPKALFTEEPTSLVETAAYLGVSAFDAVELAAKDILLK